ncbi:hypothetical protein [Longimicrobium sp.]|uniref:hypothetical protein n=1 Tax=Longimicrobium sp. TaxID=2029185 RepID=UPI002BAD206F|nr:hypothetical protein [Longimicrobium sp.]HSU17477.1 hypothetical protein [Longimicrobium sp.]
MTALQPRGRRALRHVRLPALLIAAALGAAACRGDAKETAAVGERARATAVAAPDTAEAARAPAVDPAADSTMGEVATVRGLTGGDRACYMDLESGGAVKGQQEAAFGLCERRELVGKRVRVERRRAWVLAASCEGDPECARRDTVDLIVSAEPLRATTSAPAAGAHR